MEYQYHKPADIETRSFAIIEQELAGRTFPEDIAPVVKRVIHTSADFDYADTLVFSPGAVARAKAALSCGAHIVTDTNMAKAGINKRMLAQLGGEVHCFMADEDVAAEAKRRGVTRAIVAVEKAAQLEMPVIMAVGNAPTALYRIAELMDEGCFAPELIIGVPVGFVNVVEAKEEIIRRSAPYIVARGRKGGSNIAAAIVNAILYQMVQREGF